jgi:SAM-dependent methyltransferase
MTSTIPDWGTSFRLTAAEKWKAKSATMVRDVTEALVAYADPQPKMRVLDLASGTGEPAITIAKRIAPTGHVTALDLSSDLLAIAAARARQGSLTNFTIQQADAHQLPFPDEQFDLATSRFGDVLRRHPACTERTSPRPQARSPRLLRRLGFERPTLLRIHHRRSPPPSRRPISRIERPRPLPLLAPR